jgi:hypothetical protein
VAEHGVAAWQGTVVVVVPHVSDRLFAAMAPATAAD